MVTTTRTGATRTTSTRITSRPFGVRDLLRGSGNTLSVVAAITGLSYGGQASATLTEMPPQQRQGAQVPSEGAIANPLCPVLTEEEVDPEIFTEYRGKRVYLCCRKCLKKFQADPDAYAANLPSEPWSEQAGRTATDHGLSEGDGTHLGDHVPGNKEELQEHDHSEHGSMTEGSSAAWIPWVGRLHPMVVHFPIALLMATALAEALALLTANARFAFTARYCLWLGAVAAGVAAALGWADATGVGKGYTGFSAQLLSYHRWLGTTTATLAVCALLACERAHRVDSRGGLLTYRVLVLLCVVSVVVTGHLGASLIYGWDYLTK